ncbi:hypothetical protein CASFOL_028113 [Castilleja foliolosa]|uniref:Uncharacterized protein n=1 Tax=Castilleja foliolosa TaxID=1961234 RepID=A0ABD3CDS3_9LAMI
MKSLHICLLPEELKGGSTAYPDSDIKYLALGEADPMLDMGFEPQVGDCSANGDASTWDVAGKLRPRLLETAEAKRIEFEAMPRGDSGDESLETIPFQVLNMEELYSSHDIHDVLRRWAGCFLEVITC